MSIYDNIYSLLSTFIFGGNLNGVAEQSCSLVSTALCLFVVSIPFILVWRVIRLLGGS